MNTPVATTDTSGRRPGEPWLNLGKPYWRNLDIAAVERRFGVAYIGDFCVRNSSGCWSGFPVAVFYQAAPDRSKGHTNYLGVYPSGTDVVLCDASSVADAEWSAAMAENGEILISTFRHDCRVSEDGTAMIDGGQDYTRISGCLVRVRIDGAALAKRRIPGGRMLLESAAVRAGGAGSPAARGTESLPGTR